MSASPSGPSNSGTPTANGGPPRFIRKPKPADPLRKSSSRPQRPPPLSRSSATKTNGLKPISRPGQAPQSSVPSRSTGLNSNSPSSASLPKAPSSFTEVPQGKFQDYPLYTTKRALREGLRYHVARFATRKVIDPTDQDEFTRPVSLHRRDPRLPPPGKAVKDEDPATGLPLDDKDQEKLEIARLEREAQRAADLAQIAPTGNNASALAAKKNATFRNEKTTQVYRNDSNEAQKKESDLRYEEAIPWHLEDAENKHTWVGTYEAALSKANVILIIDGNSFKMVPIEKWYKFTPKNQFKTMTIEEAEAQMSKKSKVSRWAMHTEEQQQQDQEKQATRRHLGKLYKVSGESSTFKRSGKTETQDADDLDFEGDLFEDDDEQPTVEPDRDEETKHAADKIKREQLGANLFGEGDENEVEKELQEEEKEEEAKKKLGKSMKKALKKREKNYLYDSDSSHPYSTSSDEDTSDEEKKKEEERKKEDEAKLKAKSTSKIPSGASSKGTNTPLGRPKQGEHQKKPNHLKRPGSPNLSASETSGNESSRKKHKKKHITSSSQPTATSTPAPSRPMSPAPPGSQPIPGTNARKSSIIKLNLNPSKLSEIQSAQPNPSAVMSDGEGTAGEMSDSAGDHKRKSIKLRLGSGPNHSPSASRAGSPTYESRAGSPVAVAGSQAQGQQQSMLDIYPPVVLNLSGHFLHPTMYNFQEHWSVVPPLMHLMQRLTMQYTKQTIAHWEAYVMAIEFAKANGVESEFVRSASPKAFIKAFVLARRRFYLSTNDKSVEGHQWTSLGTHLLTGTVLCDLASVSPPASGPAAPPAAKVASARPVTAEEIMAALPSAGISIGAMLKLFPGRISDKKDRDRFIKMVKENSSYSPDDKLLRPKV